MGSIGGDQCFMNFINSCTASIVMKIWRHRHHILVFRRHLDGSQSLEARKLNTGKVDTTVGRHLETTNYSLRTTFRIGGYDVVLLS